MTTTQDASGEMVHLSAEEAHKRADASRWFDKKLKIPPSTATILEQYSNIPPGKVEAHVLELRDRAFKAWPYPCIGQGRFLDLTTARHPDYARFLEKVQQGGTFLDAGCCLGQDIRKLLLDGAPSSAALYGIDIEAAFFGLGYELFQDQDKLESQFAAADLTKPLGAAIQPWAGTMDVISAQNLFHLFRLQEQKAVARALVQLSRAQPGSLISGRHLGHERGFEQSIISDDNRVFMHNPDTWRALWHEVAAETGSKWHVQTWVDPPSDRTKLYPNYTPGLNFLVWTVTREM